MSIGAEIAAQVPFLRRYARALCGSQAAGDAKVRGLLEAALADAALAGALRGGRVALYHAFSQLHLQGESLAGSPATPHEAGAQSQLQRIAPANRQALLLTTVEDFSPDEAAIILGTDAETLARMVRTAVEDIERETATSVLIIEDEPLISMQLEEIVHGLGHAICGTAATRGQAQAVVAERRPGLVLADIQLADGSSGLDAVDDILSAISVPVIFITAYPERLLTGARAEPTYLITKPFEAATVRTAISQALFFGSGQPLAQSA